MQGTNPRRLEWILAVLAVFACAAVALVFAAQPGSRAVRAAPAATTSAPVVAPAPTPAPARVSVLPAMGAATTKRPTVVRSTPRGNAPARSYLRAGIVLPVDGRIGEFVRVFTPCEATGWVHTSDVDLHQKTAGPPSSLEQATIVLDPGHGGLQSGAKGPAGLLEKDVNLAITHQLVGELEGARVFLTRDADFTAGLRYRVRLASALRAHAFVSIHNNSAPDGPSDRPGTETWHQSRSVTSHRLAGLVWAELVEALGSFNVPWVSDRQAGTRTRLNQHGQDYYALLRGSSVPAVIVEVMFISNAPEEALLRQPESHKVVAGALARSLRSYVHEAGPEAAKPYPADDGSIRGLPSTCVDPA